MDALLEFVQVDGCAIDHQLGLAMVLPIDIGESRLEEGQVVGQVFDLEERGEREQVSIIQDADFCFDVTEWSVA